MEEQQRAEDETRTKRRAENETRTKEKDVLVRLFREALSTAQLLEPISHYPEHCKIQKKNGADLGNASAYQNDDAACSFLSAVAEEYRERQALRMVKGRFFSYSIDGSEEGRRSGSEAEVAPSKTT